MNKHELEQSIPHLRSAVLVTAERFFGEGAEEAEDVAQEVLLRLWQRCEVLRRDEVEGLAHTIARNLCVSIYRRQSHMGGRLGDVPEASCSVTPATHAVENDNQRLLQLAVEKLPPAWQRLLRMHAETDMTTREMANILNIKSESVSAMLSAARRKLYETLKPVITG